MKANHVGPFTVANPLAPSRTWHYSDLAGAIGAAAAAAHYDGCAHVVRRGDGRKVRTVQPDGIEARRYAARELLRRCVPPCGTIYVDCRPTRGTSRTVAVYAFAPDDTGRTAKYWLTGAVAALRGGRMVGRSTRRLVLAGHGYSAATEVAETVAGAIGRTCSAETL